MLTDDQDNVEKVKERDFQPGGSGAIGWRGCGGGGIDQTEIFTAGFIQRRVQRQR